jgi:hypothetical protein
LLHWLQCLALLRLLLAAELQRVLLRVRQLLLRLLQVPLHGQRRYWVQPQQVLGAVLGQLPSLMR